MSKSVKSFCRLLGGSALAALAMPVAAQAQANPPANVSGEGASSPAKTGAAGIGDIIVTAQRRDERLQDVPIAITAQTNAQLRASGVTNTLQLAEVTPGLSFTYTAGNTQVRIRGVGTSTFGPGVENPTAMYVDGVYVASTAGAFFNLANIERIEVLKGPQGTLFGRNATGGLVQVVTPDPSFDPHGLIRAGYGNYQTGATDLYVTGGATDNLAADFALHYSHQGKGWGTNVNTGNDVNRLDDDLIVKSKVLYKPTDTLKFVLSGDYAYSNGSSSLTLQQKPGIQNIGVFEKILTNRLDANAANDLPLINHGGYYDNSATVDPEGTIRAYGASLTSTLDLGFASLKSITAYRRTVFDLQFDIERVPQDFLTFNGSERWRQFSQEVQLSSNAGGRLQWTLGGFYFHSNDQYAPSNVVFGASGAPLFVSPVFTSAVQTIDSGQKTNSYAGYAQATYEVLPKTHITLGGRYTSESRDAYGTQQFIGYIGTLAVPLVPAGTPYALGIDPHLHFNNFSYRVALDHKFGRNVLAYVSYNTGFKSGGFNINTIGNPAFRPEKLNALEVGLKTELFDRKLRVNISAFTYDYRNIQVNNFVTTSQFISNGARARIKGVEADLLAQPVRGITLSGSVAYTHDRFTDYPDADYNYVVPDCNYSNPSSSRVCQASANGNKLPGTPTFTANAGASYETAIGNGQAGISGNFYHSSGYFGTTDNDPRVRQTAYNVVNGTVFWEPKVGGPRLSAWGKNLFGKHYALNYYISSAQVTYQAAAPRTYGFTIEQKF